MIAGLMFLARAMAALQKIRLPAALGLVTRHLACDKAPVLGYVFGGQGFLAVEGRQSAAQAIRIQSRPCRGD